VLIGKVACVAWEEIGVSEKGRSKECSTGVVQRRGTQQPNLDRARCE